jgi:hypothetical protein
VAAEKPAGKLRKLNPGGADKPTQIGSGMNFPVAKLIELLEPAQWEEFTEEWATSLKSYKDVERRSGPGDMGRDIVAFTTDKKYDGPWDNYQCKRYALKLQPNHPGARASFCDRVSAHHQQQKPDPHRPVA